MGRTERLSRRKSNVSLAKRRERLALRHVIEDDAIGFVACDIAEAMTAARQFDALYCVERPPMCPQGRARPRSSSPFRSPLRYRSGRR